MNITKEQWEEIVDGILSFNRLVTDKQERETEEYLLLYGNLIDEELKEYSDSDDNSVNELKEMCDVIVVTTQYIDAITPSQLSYDNLVKVYNWLQGYYGRGGGGTTVGSSHFMSLIAGTLIEADHRNYDLYGAMMEVNFSNLSKIPFCSDFHSVDGNDLSFYMDVAHTIESNSNGRYKGVSFISVEDNDGQLRVMFRDLDKKVLKPPQYTSPDLSRFLT